MPVSEAQLALPETTSERATRRHLLLGWLAAVLAIGLLLTTYRYLDRVAGGAGWDLRRPLINEMTATLGAGLLFFAVRRLVRQRPLLGAAGWRAVPWYGLALLGFSGLHTTLNWALRSAIYPLAGLGEYGYGPLLVRYAMELPIDVLVFTIMVAVLTGVDQVNRARAKTLETARLSQDLAEARLESLQRSLEPHFLFNALNTISATMYQDVAAADQMIEHLGDLLRGSLAQRPGGEVTVAEELDMVAPYVALLEARFEDRLQIDFEVDSASRQALLPAMLLQPLIENAVRHGGAETRGHGQIEVRIERSGAELRVKVLDDGPGVSKDVAPQRAGLGLRSTVERLRLLYGERQQLSFGNRDPQEEPTSGFQVDILLPWRQREAVSGESRS